MISVKETTCVENIVSAENICRRNTSGMGRRTILCAMLNINSYEVSDNNRNNNHTASVAQSVN
jgi:hypothetical protein